MTPRSGQMTRFDRKAQLHPRTHHEWHHDGAGVSYRPAFLSAAEAMQLTDSLIAAETIDWRDHPIVMFGRKVRQPRRTAWIADPGIDYRYSGLTLQPVAWPAPLAALRQRLSSELGHAFNSVLANLYRDGADYMGWHRDNERQLGAQPLIASLSLGATRYFDLRHRHYRENELPVHRYELRSGDLIVMHGNTQRDWHHRVPRQRSADGYRINLSFRHTAPAA